MLLVVIQFPPIKSGKDAERREWLVWSNQEYAKHKGFIRRKLLKPHKGGNYVTLMEHDSYDTFIDMHSSPTQAASQQRLKPLLDGSPRAQFYEVVLE